MAPASSFSEPNPEAIANAREAIEGCILALKDLGRPVPEEREATQAIVLEVAA